MTRKAILHKLWMKAPLSWAIIRTAEVYLLSQIKYKRPILEVGCGDGFVTQTLFNKLYAVDVGIDLDKEELRRAQKTKLYKLLRKEDITSTSFKNNSFSTVFANGVLEHIPNLSEALVEINRILKKGGQLITTSPTNNYCRLLFYYRLLHGLKLNPLANIYGRCVNRFFAHIHLYDHLRWEKLLTQAGLKLEYYTYYNNKFSIGIHDICLPFAIFTKFLKAKTDRMVLLPKVRSIFVPPLSKLIEQRIFEITNNYNSNASIFMVAKKI